MHTTVELPAIEMNAHPVASCQLCGELADSKYTETPYWMCGNCDLWFQRPLPDKSFESLEEKGEDGRSGGHDQSAADLEASAHLARCFAKNWIHKLPPIGRVKYKTLDIGCKYPWFAHTLKKEFDMDAYGIDGMDFDSPQTEPILSKYQEELGVPMLILDFEKVDTEELLKKTKDGMAFDAISLVHVFEHFYDPAAALHKLHQLLWLDGTLLIRMPSHEVGGFQNHLSPAHYSIHPYFYSEKAMKHLLDKVDLFDLAETYPLGGGVRDYILKPR